MKDKIIGSNGEFINKKLENNFMSETWPEQIKPVILITLLIIIGSFSIDTKKIILFNFTNDLTILLALKSMVFLTGIFLILFNLTQSLIKSSSLITFVFIVSSGLYLTGETIIKSETITITFSILILLIFLFYFFYNFKVFYITLGCILTSVLFVSGNYYYNKMEITYLIVISIILLIANLGGFFSYLKISQLKRKAYFLEIKKNKLRNNVLKYKMEQKSKENELLNYNEEKKETNSQSNGFFEKLEEEFLRSKRYSTELSVLIIKINKFDMIINRLGEKTADFISKDFQKTCKQEIRPAGDFFEQTSKNEFSFLLPSTDEYGTVSLLERLTDKTSKKTYKIKNKKVKITISTGIACLANEKDPLALFEHAKTALSQSKYKSTKEAVFF